MYYTPYLAFNDSFATIEEEYGLNMSIRLTVDLSDIVVFEPFRQESHGGAIYDVIMCERVDAFPALVLLCGDVFVLQRQVSMTTGPPF